MIFFLNFGLIKIDNFENLKKFRNKINKIKFLQRIFLDTKLFLLILLGLYGL